MDIAITGANGLIGGVLRRELDPGYFKIRPIDLPTDVSDYEQLAEAVDSCDAILHFAWKDLIANVRGNTRDPMNIAMAQNVYAVAASMNIPRLIIGSSNQAHGDTIRDADGLIRPSTPDNPRLEYGREKLEIEAMGRQYAEEHGTEVVCLRIGNVNEADKPRSTEDGRPQHWLSQRDLGRLVSKCLIAPVEPYNFQIIYGVSSGSDFDWVNPFGYVPLDTA